jgi:hypothetical protein
VLLSVGMSVIQLSEDDVSGGEVFDFKHSWFRCSFFLFQFVSTAGHKQSKSAAPSARTVPH